jgi:DNA/RNA endonuclease YhcR with UshA esterase domain
LEFFKKNSKHLEIRNSVDSHSVEKEESEDELYKGSGNWKELVKYHY